VAKPGATVVYFKKADAAASRRLANEVHGKLKAAFSAPGTIVTWKAQGNTILIAGTGSSPNCPHWRRRAAWAAAPTKPPGSLRTRAASVPLPACAMSAAPASALLASVIVAAPPRGAHDLGRGALCAPPWSSPGALLHGAAGPYLVGTLTSAVFVFAVTPFVESIGSHPLWVGPTSRSSASST